MGLLQPVVVRQVAPGRYELIMGERRWRACREAGLDAIPAIIRATDDEKLLLDALLENLHRAQLNPLEEAAAYDQLLQDFNCTHDQLADRIGRSRPQVSNTLRLLKLSPPVQRRVAAGVLSAGHARALLSVEDSAEQDRLAHRIVAEGLSVRAVEEIVTLMASEPTSSVKPKGPRAGARVSPALSELATRLSDRFETRVKVDLGQKKGKITVEFARWRIWSASWARWLRVRAASWSSDRPGTDPRVWRGADRAGAKPARSAPSLCCRRTMGQWIRCGHGSSAGTAHAGQPPGSAPTLPVLRLLGTGPGQW